MMTKTLFIHSVPPEIAAPSSDVVVNVSETAVIDCRATGTPSPAVQWLVNGQPLDRTDQRYYIARDGRTLRITDTRVADSGTYTCLAQNSVGAAERHFNLDVLGMRLIIYILYSY